MRKFIMLVVFSTLFCISVPVLALESPSLTVTTNGTLVKFSWTSVPSAEGYTFFYAPYPDVSYINQVDVGPLSSLLFDLWDGAAFYVAIAAHDGSTQEFSNIEFFSIKLQSTATPQSLGIVAKTGQTISYYSGDDGSLQKGVSWPQPRFQDNGDGTVKDNLTGLIWMKNVNCWGDLSWGEALLKIKYLNSGNEVCGGYTGNQTDWRLPNVNELESLVEYGNKALKNDSALQTGHPFKEIVSYRFWSSTIAESNIILTKPIKKLFNVNFKSGYISIIDTFWMGVWPVSGETSSSYPAPIPKTKYPFKVVDGGDGDLQKGIDWPEPRFIYNNDGTIFDNLTNLMWMGNTDCGWGTRSWENALDKINALNNGNDFCNKYTGSYNDWRLPNVKELRSVAFTGWTSTAGDPGWGTLDDQAFYLGAALLRHA